MMIASNEMHALDIKGIADPSYGIAGEAFIKTQIQVIQSSEILSKVYERLGDEANSCNIPSIVRIPGTNLVNITVKSLSPEAAAKFANTVAEVYVDFMYRRKITISSTGANLLRDQLKEVQINRDKAMEDLLKFKEEHGIYDLKQSYNNLVNQRNELETKLFEAKMDCEEISTTLDEVNNNRSNAVVMLPYLIPDGNSNLSTLQNLLLTHQMKLPELLTNYSMEHKAVKVHEEVKQMIQEASEAQVDVSLNGLKLKLQRAQRRCDSLQAQINDKEQELIKLDKIGGDYRMREAACDKLDETITMITSRINELQIADATTIGNYNISKINDAKPNKKPVFPQPKKVLGLAFLGGLAFAALISFILVSINNKVTDVSQITQAFNESVPVFGSIPLFNDSEDKLLQSNGEEPVDEVFRDIRTSLNLSMMTRNTKIIAVTSALPHEGKTFMTCNLARSFARDNKRIPDYKNHSYQKYTFGVAPYYNLTEKIKLGVNNSYSERKYTNNKSHDDSKTYEIMPFVDYRQSRSFSVHFGAGVSHTDYTGRSQGTNGDGDWVPVANLTFRYFPVSNFFLSYISTIDWEDSGSQRGGRVSYYNSLRASWQITHRISFSPGVSMDIRDERVATYDATEYSVFAHLDYIMSERIWKSSTPSATFSTTSARKRKGNIRTRSSSSQTALDTISAMPSIRTNSRKISDGGRRRTSTQAFARPFNGIWTMHGGGGDDDDGEGGDGRILTAHANAGNRILQAWILL